MVLVSFGSTVGTFPLGFWAAPLSVGLDDSPVLLLLGLALSEILVLLVSAMPRVQSQKGVRAGDLSSQHRPGLEAQAPPAAGVGGSFACGHRNVLCPWA